MIYVCLLFVWWHEPRADWGGLKVKVVDDTYLAEAKNGREGGQGDLFLLPWKLDFPDFHCAASLITKQVGAFVVRGALNYGCFPPL